MYIIIDPDDGQAYQAETIPSDPEKLEELFSQFDVISLEGKYPHSLVEDEEGNLIWSKLLNWEESSSDEEE